MKLQSNRMFITGGGTGIGRGLAEAFHKLGNKVIIGGRRKHVLQEVCAANPGMEHVLLDVANSDQVLEVAGHLTSTFPDLNCIINNAGIQRALDFAGDSFPLSAYAEEVQTNLIGLIAMCTAFLPQLKKQPHASILNVSSGLGLVPLSRVPVYSATKAAVHSFTMSLRHQLRDTSVEVIELIPPSVATDLRAGREGSARGPQPMPLDEYISETMKGLERGDSEIAVGTACFALAAASNDDFRKIFGMMNP